VFALAEAQIMLATMMQRYTLAIEDKRPVLPVGRLTVQPSHAPMFTLERTSLS
jgi:cytochrome P450